MRDPDHVDERERDLPPSNLADHRHAPDGS
jgi:hypothetical protein